MRPLLVVFSLVTIVPVAGQETMTISIANNSLLGTIVNETACLVGGTQVEKCSPGSTVAIGIVQNGAGMSGTAIIAISGTVNCIFDGATTAGDFVQTSSVHGGDCSDSATVPSAGRGLGRVLTTNATNGTYAIVLTPAGAGNWATAQIPNTSMGWSSSTGATNS